MQPIKIYVTDYIEQDLKWEEEQLARYAHVTFEYDQLKFKQEEELVAAIGDADMVLVNMVKMTANVINGLEKCKLILRHGVDARHSMADQKKLLRLDQRPEHPPVVLEHVGIAHADHVRTAEHRPRS